MLKNNAVAIGASTKPSFKAWAPGTIEDGFSGIVYEVIIVSYLIGK